MAREIDQEEFRSSLPWFKLTELDKGKLGVECPRADCHGKVVVNGRKWREGTGPTRAGTVSRSCTYCFRVARIK